MFNGSGVYTLPGAALANGEIVSATENNQFRNDVAAALNVAWTRDGQAPATANIPMGSHKLTGLAAGTGVGDSVRFEQLPSNTNLLPVASGGTGSGTASGARTNLGLVIGTDVQAYSAELQGATQGGINGMKNRIINGAMMIDQRNDGASVNNATGTLYTVDRWVSYGAASGKFSIQQNAASVTPPTGFVNYLGVTSLSAYTVGAGESFQISQNVEGLNVADLGWGAAGASTVTLSFWVRSSLTGTFGGALQNGSYNYSYPFSYTISAANTWEQKTITIAGPTSGTWLKTNGIGIVVNFSLGIGSTYSGTAGSWAATNYGSATGATSVVGTNGATFYITGVQLEKGSTATSFDYRSYGQELQLCKRYFDYIVNNSDTTVGLGRGDAYYYFAMNLPLMRANPTLALNGTLNVSNYSSNVTTLTSVLSQKFTIGNNLQVIFTTAGTYSLGAYIVSTSGYISLSAEL